MTLALGLEIGGTKLQAGVGGEDGRLLAVARRRVDPALGAEGIRAAIPGLLDEAVSQAGARAGEVRSIGVGFGGPVDSKAGRVLVSHQIEGWSGFGLREWLGGLRRLPAVVQNDCKAAAFAEASCGAGRGCRRIFYVTVGSGIGGGLVVDGRVDEGQGLGAGEIGHTWVPRPGSGAPEKLELVASGWSIERRARERMEGALTAEGVYRAAEEGNPAARAVLEEATDALALGIANVVALLAPERVILGGGVSRMGPLFWEPLRAKAAARGFAPFAGRWEIVPSALGDEVVVVGALLLALQDRAPSY